MPGFIACDKAKVCVMLCNCWKLKRN